MKKVIFIIGTCLIVLAMAVVVLKLNVIKQGVASEYVHNQKTYKRASPAARAIIDKVSFSAWFPSERNTKIIVRLIDGE